MLVQQMGYEVVRSSGFLGILLDLLHLLVWGILRDFCNYFTGCLTTKLATFCGYVLKKQNTRVATK